MNLSTSNLAQRGSEVPRVLLPVIFRIFEAWKLSGAQQMKLLGLSNEKTLYNWKNVPEKAKLSPDHIERASYILGIYKALQVLFPTQSNADHWLATGNDNPMFNGQAPIDRLMSGHMVDLATIRAHLDAVRGG